MWSSVFIFRIFRIPHFENRFGTSLVYTYVHWILLQSMSMFITISIYSFYYFSLFCFYKNVWIYRKTIFDAAKAIISIVGVVLSFRNFESIISPRASAHAFKVCMQSMQLALLVARTTVRAQKEPWKAKICMPLRRMPDKRYQIDIGKSIYIIWYRFYTALLTQRSYPGNSRGQTFQVRPW
jgi:hypothetical protein